MKHFIQQLKEVLHLFLLPFGEVGRGLFIIALFFTSCEDEVKTYSYDENLIAMIVADNPNLSFLNTAITRTEMFDTLLQTGPYTLFAPSDDAFSTSGYSASSINSTGKTALTKIIRYHVLEGTDPLTDLSLGFNQEITAKNGSKYFVTLYEKNSDTLLTINGVSAHKQLYAATNGNIRVITRVLEPYTFEYLTDALANEADLTLFMQALRKTTFNRLLSERGNEYTVFAPVNSAMVKYGYSTLGVISNKSTEELEAFVSCYIVSKRRFVNDYILLDDGSEKGTEQLYNGEELAINLIPDSSNPGSYTGITLAGGTKETVNISRRDLLAGNGVLHIIDKVLPE